MKTAIVCDWLVTLGGAEKVLGELFQCFPDADLFAVVDFLEPHQRDFLRHKTAKTTFIQKLPFARKKYRSYLPLMPLAIEQLDLSSYELIISSSHAVAKGVITGPDQLHISYVHSPMRYAWDLQHQYLRETGLDKKPQGLLARYFLHKLRLWDLRSANGVDYFIANSHFIANRIRKTYRRDATVIHPPVDIARFMPGHQKEDFYLTASRLVPYKKIDLIVESFSAMPDKKLVVIGDGPDFAKIKAKTGSNVELLGYQPNEVLIDHMQRAKAFVFAAEEDFGIVPLEAQACGTPVIALGKGGALETVRGIAQEKPTGVFFSEQTVRAVCEAVSVFENNRLQFNIENCVENARQFSPEQFRYKIQELVQKKWDQSQIKKGG
ncbi:glycosyltransferase family 4 protein [Aquicella lusitana]|uniref:Glycosyltransferase involved in cell wall biosynthesis n=1 Tax=Aquicella lusitana TaxID=254246 RepID=A0A370GWU4_9COXI|nr:glycosyltransferase family 4 protein [Aquicella lusitana]RDI48122.1 glycosyltransferase involved in cell wall biosynthesis [Aquicella lusitana]VVC72862.1 GDP-mannose-dependent alpha-(1-6)-phosphatidylinositol monomannoside mannosyltransferase [Aquicella lusitana]